MPQFSSFRCISPFLGGQILFGNSLTKTALLVSVAVGCILHPKVKISTVSMVNVGSLYRIPDRRGHSPYHQLRYVPGGDALFSYYNYYLLVLDWPRPVNLPRRGFATNSCPMLCSYICSLRDDGSRTTF